MEKKGQADDNVSFSDHMSDGLSSSAGTNKTCVQNQRDPDVSAVSWGARTSIRSDLSSEDGDPINKGRKCSDGKAEEVSQGDRLVKAPYPRGQLKAESCSSKESSEVVRLSSVDSSEPCQSSNDNPGRSDGTKNTLRKPGSSVATGKSEQEADRGHHSPHLCEFDLNEGMEAIGAEFHQQSLDELSSSVRATRLSEPIPVVAKVGVPVGLPEKPLQFGGELGWRPSASASAFRPAFSSNSEKEKSACGNPDGCGSTTSQVSHSFDLNIAATMDPEPELPSDEASVNIPPSRQPERFLLDLNREGEDDEDHQHKKEASGFDLNDNPVVEDKRRNTSLPGESRQWSGNGTVGAVNCSGGNVPTQPLSEGRRPPYWVDLSSMRAFGHVQGQPFLVAAPTSEQVRMMVPLQSEVSFLQHAPPGLYISKINHLPPAFYPPNLLPHPNDQHGPTFLPQISGPVLASYPGTFHVLEGPQAFNHPSAYTNVRPTFVQNASLALMENGGRAVMLGEKGTTTPLEQVNLHASVAKRREPDGGRESSQANYRRMASRY